MSIDEKGVGLVGALLRMRLWNTYGKPWLSINININHRHDWFGHKNGALGRSSRTTTISVMKILHVLLIARAHFKHCSFDVCLLVHDT